MKTERAPLKPRSSPELIAAHKTVSRIMQERIQMAREKEWAIGLASIDRGMIGAYAGYLRTQMRLAGEAKKNETH